MDCRRSRGLRLSVSILLIWQHGPSRRSLLWLLLRFPASERCEYKLCRRRRVGEDHLSLQPSLAHFFIHMALLVSSRAAIAYVLLATVMVASDSYVFSLASVKERAVADSLAHALVSGLLWATVEALLLDNPLHPRSIIRIVIAMVASSALDVDHFIAAGSMSIEDAANLDKRPYLHSIVVALFAVAVIHMLSLNLGLYQSFRLPFIMICAVLSHLLRDAVRRGLWFWPLDLTIPVCFSCYIIIVLLLPWPVATIVSKIEAYAAATLPMYFASHK